MKGQISVSIVAFIAVTICSSWNSVAQAQGYQSRRAEWQQRVLQDANPGMTPAAAFGDEPLLAEREYPLHPVPANGTGQAPSVLDPVGPTRAYNDCGCGGSPCNECGDCGECRDSGPTCDACVCGSCECCCYDQYTGLIPPETFSRLLRRCEFFGGVHAFKGPIDQGSNGNFGFHGGVNLGGALGGYHRNGYQLGVSVTGSDYSGSTIMGEDTGDRKQLFFTGGVFHRALNGGMQVGAVYDFMQDSFYFGRAHVGQIRGEISWGRTGYHELGFWGAFRTRSDQLTETIGATTYNWELKPTNLYAFFYRRSFSEGGELRLWGGFTGNSKGMVGADARVPLGKSWALEGDFNYLIPKETQGTQGTTEESWGLILNLVWYPGRSAKCASCDPYRPLFDVGNNNSFITELQ